MVQNGDSISVHNHFRRVSVFHELGHFLFAKRAGILVREFAIGMGPKILGITRGETLYTVRLLPIGGYVRMAGEEMDAIHLQAGHRIGLLLDEKDRQRKSSSTKSMSILISYFWKWNKQTSKRPFH
nr:site-2 protease family protein [Planococcus sp. MB-3u-03]